MPTPFLAYGSEATAVRHRIPPVFPAVPFQGLVKGNYCQLAILVPTQIWFFATGISEGSELVCLFSQLSVENVNTRVRHWRKTKPQTTVMEQERFVRQLAYIAGGDALPRAPLEPGPCNHEEEPRLPPIAGVP